MARYKQPPLTNPCLRCAQVADPENCQNKNCVDWQLWFTTRWDRMRQNLRQDMEALDLKPIGVNIGGNYYTPSHQRQAYLRKDPCKECFCPKDLCITPCPLRRSWEEAKGDGLY